MAEILSQGTRVWFADPDAPFTVQEIECVTNIDNLSSGPSEQIDVTCLSDLYRRFRAGLKTPSAITLPFNFDPDSPGQSLLAEMKETGDNLQFAVGLSDGNDVPTVDSDGIFVTTGYDRFFAFFEGNVQDFALAVPQNGVVGGTATIQVSGQLVFVKANAS